jgi:thiol-disulfide isomerase/thioredoxin
MSKFVNFNNMNLGSQISSSDSFFSRLQNVSKNLNLNTLIYILAAILFISLAYYIYNKFIAPKLNPKYVPNREIMTGDETSNVGQKQAELLFFFANWCPHCKTAKPIWENVKSQYENKTINGYKLIFTPVDCTKESDETENMMNKYNVEGFPTIKLLKDNQIIEYDAKVTKETLEQFINTII